MDPKHKEDKKAKKINKKDELKDDKKLKKQESKEDKKDDEESKLSKTIMYIKRKLKYHRVTNLDIKLLNSYRRKID